LTQADMRSCHPERRTHGEGMRTDRAGQLGAAEMRAFLSRRPPFSSRPDSRRARARHLKQSARTQRRRHDGPASFKAAHGMWPQIRVVPLSATTAPIPDPSWSVRGFPVLLHLNPTARALAGRMIRCRCPLNAADMDMVLLQPRIAIMACPSWFAHPGCSGGRGRGRSPSIIACP